MPIYEYRCKKCESLFEKFHWRSKEEEKITCPRCGAEEVERTLSFFSSLFGRGSSSSCGGGSTRFT